MCSPSVGDGCGLFWPVMLWTACTKASDLVLALCTSVMIFTKKADGFLKEFDLCLTLSAATLDCNRLYILCTSDVGVEITPLLFGYIARFMLTCIMSRVYAVLWLKSYIPPPQVKTSWAYSGFAHSVEY